MSLYRTLAPTFNPHRSTLGPTHFLRNRRRRGAPSPPHTSSALDLATDVAKPPALERREAALLARIFPPEDPRKREQEQVTMSASVLEFAGTEDGSNSARQVD